MDSIDNCIHYFCFTSSVGNLGKRIIEGLENKGKTLTYFYMNGCPHCVKFTPEWDKFASSNATGIKTQKVEAERNDSGASQTGYKWFSHNNVIRWE